MLSVCLFTSHKWWRKIYQFIFICRYRSALQMGWIKHMLPASADSSLRSCSKLTTFHHVKLGCLDWIRSDLLWSISAVTHHFVFFEMVTKIWLFIFFQPDNSAACFPLWFGVSLVPFQSHGCSLLCHNSIGTTESSFKAVSANSFTILGQNSPAKTIWTHVVYPIIF